jgi:hypothetical protein
MLESDVAGDRETRRAEAGHVAPSAAASFLKLARELDVTERDPMTRAYFRNVGRRGAPSPRQAAAVPRAGARPASGLARLLSEAGVAGSPLSLPAPDSPKAEPLVVSALRRLAADEPRRFFERSEELAYLANVLVAGCAFQGRRFRPAEAVLAAVATTNLGLELATGPAAGRDGLDAAVRLLAERALDLLFRSAFRVLHVDVVTRAIRATTERLRAESTPTGGQTPARARLLARLEASVAPPPRSLLDDLTVDGAFEASELQVLAGLWDACPSLFGPLARDLPSRSGPGAPSFISTRADLAAVGTFLDALARAPGSGRPKP